MYGQFDPEYLKEILELHANSRVVGWYASSPVNDISFKLNQQFVRDLAIWPMLHLSVSPDTLDMHAFMDASVGDELPRLGTIFHPIPVSSASKNELAKCLCYSFASIC